MTIELSGETELYEQLQRISEVISKSFWINVQEEAEDTLLKNVRPHFVTGRLERNSYVDIIPNGVELGVRNNGMMVDWRGGRINYGAFVEYGTRPHTIKPKDKKALRWASGGGFVFAKKVNHPGYKGDSFLRNAAEETFNNLNKIFKKTLQEELR